MALFDKTNNYGNLTVNSPGQILYPGQTGTVAANGFNYASFPTEQAGFDALVNYVQRHVASGWNTVSSFVYGYLGTSSNNAANPAVGNYLKAVEQGSGLSGSITSGDAVSIARGIATGEGNAGALNMVSQSGVGLGTVGNVNPISSQTPQAGGGLMGFVNSFVQASDGFAQSAVDLTNGNIGGAASGAAGAVSGITPGQAATNSAAANSPGLVQQFTSWVNGGIGRVGLGVLGIGIVLVALTLLAASSKTVQSAALTAARVAA